ncbi:YaaC family protein [Bradyrhizobium elkanii]|uniref:YaaC family protein n=1 Tax=Bradyrhizobium elkanii TaxID=29448 RepID=UPI0004274DB6|nr:YaaC family protein [Bradyrhizobium elkanii]
MYDWSKIRFLESTENLKSIVRQSTGRTPSTTAARGIAACLQQGRIFFEIASIAPLQVKPLQLYYGIVGFAKAIILARQGRSSIATLAQSHGLSEISEHNAKIEDMTLQFRGNGLFAEFNDTVAALGRLFYYDERGSFQQVPKPFDLSASLTDSRCTLKDVLARIPGLETAYQRTFGELPACWPIELEYQGQVSHLRLYVPSTFSDREELRLLVQTWRAKFPFLDDWCFTQGSRAWDQSYLTFNNYEKPAEGEFSPEYLVLRNDSFGPYRKTMPNARSFAALLPALAGGIIVDHVKAIEPLNGVLLSEFALHFCAAFILSSLVRYRPQIWQHALSHSALEGRPTDDRALSLIEKFLEIVLLEFPKLVEKAIDWANSHDLRV